MIHITVSCSLKQTGLNFLQLTDTLFSSRYQLILALIPVCREYFINEKR
jgi:hypothetical protein